MTVRAIAKVGDGDATDAPVAARADQQVTLFALVTIAGKHYSDAPRVKLRGKQIAVQPIAAAPRLALAWHKIEPAAASYSNTEGSSFEFKKIEYRATPITGATTQVVADVHPTLTPDYGNGLGTMRYQVVATLADGTVATSPGVDALRGRGSGGLADSVMRVSLRRDDTFLGYLTEMFGQPYIWASAGTTDATHQSERLEGSDCADLMVYGARRGGKAIAYTWTGGLPQVTKLVSGGTRDPETGVYLDAKGAPIPFPKIGDLIVFPRHVGALVLDKGKVGVLDDQDIVMHTLFDSPKEEPIAKTGYGERPVEIRRWK